MIATLRELTRQTTGATIEPITVEQYHEMMRTGILLEGSPIELIDGMIVRKDRGDCGDELMHGPRHASAVRKMARLLRDVERFDCFCQIQLPVTLAVSQEPEPDAAVVLGNEEDFNERHPASSDIVAVIEVADSSLSYDRTTKQAIYAAAEIPVYWIVNLVGDILEVYSRPIAEERRYAERCELRSGEIASLEIAPGKVISVAVGEMFPH